MPPVLPLPPLLLPSAAPVALLPPPLHCRVPHTGSVRRGSLRSFRRALRVAYFAMTIAGNEHRCSRRVIARALRHTCMYLIVGRPWRCADDVSRESVYDLRYALRVACGAV